MPLIPRLFFGRSDVSALLVAHATYQDDGQNYDIFFRNDRFPPAGVGGEAAFYTLYLALSFEVETPITITPIIDDVRLPTVAYTLEPGADVRTDTIIEMSLMQPIPGYPTRGKFAPRGGWFQVEIASAFPGAAAFVQVDACEVEIEVVQEGKQEGANP